MADFKIDLTEEFPYLSHAPIIEAVIAVHVTADVPLEEKSLEDELKKRLPDYPAPIRQQQVEFMMTVQPDKQPEHTMREPTWQGMQMFSADRHYVVQFNRDAFVFSRLAPYEGWDKFHAEAMRVWQIYAELAQPSTIQRVGLRYINRILVPVRQFDAAEEYLNSPPKLPNGLQGGCTNFMHNDIFCFPGLPFGLRILQTIEQPQNPAVKEVGIILDIDAFSLYPSNVDVDTVQRLLPNLRWLKNKAFFGSLTKDKIERLK